MFGSDLLEVGIGMTLLFLFMSLIATSLMEILENLLKARSRYLEKAIGELLRGTTAIGGAEGATEANGTGSAQANAVKLFITKFYRHPLIAALYEGDYRPNGRHLPSYIPRENFSLALLDIVSDASAAGKALSLTELRGSLAGVSSPNAVQRVILTAIDTANGDIQKVRQSLEQWFDGTMDRCSGWYTRRSGRILFLVGFLATVFFNVDAITVAERLLHDSALRKIIVASAIDTVQDPKNGPKPVADPVDGETMAKPRTISELSSDLGAIGFPIGWTARGFLPYPTPQACSPVLISPTAKGTVCALSIGGKVQMIFGWLITTLAVTLGAPFWFDILNRLVVIRSTVKPTEKSPNEADGRAPRSEVVVRLAGDGPGAAPRAPAADGP